MSDSFQSPVATAQAAEPSPPAHTVRGAGQGRGSGRGGGNGQGSGKNIGCVN